MTILEQFDLLCEASSKLHKNAKEIEHQAELLYNLALTLANVSYRDRGPNFDCWYINETNEYFSTPREALKNSIKEFLQP